jgi:2-oxoglutarate ferredoxin oxidoreductase subunit alpha
VIETLIGEQFKGKEKLIAPTCTRCIWAATGRAEPRMPDRPARARADKVGDRIFIEGNARPRSARLWRRHGLRLVSDHALVLAGRGLQRYCKRCARPETGKASYAIVQAEDEIASIGMVIGAGWNGARAFTATSGPGISLMQEFFGLAYFAEIPAVIFDVQRGRARRPACRRAPSSPTCSACAYASHGDTKHVLLFPEDPASASSSPRSLRPRRPAADADLRDARSRHRHERAAVRAVPWDDSAAHTTAAR